MRNQLKTVALLGWLSGLLIAIRYWIIGGSTGVIMGIALAAVTNLGCPGINQIRLRWQPITPSW